MTDYAPQGRPLTGRKVLLIAVSAFAVIIAANMALVVAATGSFPGLIVKNSYVASQGFDARRDAAKALGWQTAVGYAKGRLRVELSDAVGAPLDGQMLTAVVGRPAQDSADQTLALAPMDGGYAADIVLATGAWSVRLTAADAPDYVALARLFVAEGE